jgi:hypothetical protein
VKRSIFSAAIVEDRLSGLQIGILDNANKTEAPAGKRLLVDSHAGSGLLSLVFHPELFMLHIGVEVADLFHCALTYRNLFADDRLLIE